MKCFLFSLCIAAFFLLCAPSHARTGESYDLPRLIELALGSRPEMKIAQSQESEARELLGEAKSHRYPQLNLDLSYTRLNEKPYLVVPQTTVNADVDLSGIKSDYPILAAVPDSISVPITVPQTKAIIAGQDVFSLKAELKQPIYTGGKIAERVRQARYLGEIYKSQEERSADEIAHQVEALYFQLAFANRAFRAVEAAKSRVGVVAKFLDNLYRNYTPKAGEKGIDMADYLKATFTLSKMEGLRSEVIRLRDEARRSLMLACGLPSDDFTVRDEAEKYAYKLPASDIGGLKEIALGNRPEIKQMELTGEISASEIKRAKAGYAPDIGIFGHYRHIEDNNPGDQENLLAVGVGASIPIFNGLRTGKEIRRAKAAHERTRSQKELMGLKVAMDVEILHNRLQDFARKIEIGKVALAHARARRDLESQSYVTDAREYEDYLEAMDDEINAELMLVRTTAEYYTALSALHLALGYNDDAQSNW